MRIRILWAIIRAVSIQTETLKSSERAGAEYFRARLTRVGDGRIVYGTSNNQGRAPSGRDGARPFLFGDMQRLDRNGSCILQAPTPSQSHWRSGDTNRTMEISGDST